MAIRDIQLRATEMLSADNEARQICEQLLTAFSNRIPDRDDIFTYSALAKLAGTSSDSEALHRCLAFLTSAVGCKVFEMHFFFYDPTIDGQAEVDSHAVREAARMGFMVNPLTGIPERNYREFLHPYFVPSDLLSGDSD